MNNSIRVVDIKLRDHGRSEIFLEGLFRIKFGDLCIIESDGGKDYGRVLSNPRNIELSEGNGFKKILRRAFSTDVEQINSNRRLANEANGVCKDFVRQHQLDMKMVAAEYSFDRNRILFYFTAPERIDFRDLVRDLAAQFKTRIEMRQIGPRDAAKIFGGLAPCGKTDLCCTQFLKKFEMINTRMAKLQKLPVDQDRLLGACGRLKCCLRYEVDTYTELSKTMPQVGVRVKTTEGDGIIVDVFFLKESVNVKLDDAKRVEFPIKKIEIFRVK